MDTGRIIGRTSAIVIMLASSGLMVGMSGVAGAETPGVTCDGRPATIIGSDDPETIPGTAGADVIAALGGDDVVLASGGADWVCGGDGADQIDGGPGEDFVFGDAGLDRVTGGLGRDWVAGGEGDDELHGGDDNDQMHGHAGTDRIFGELGDDVMEGWAGDDHLDGGDGGDRLWGGDDQDHLLGGLGNDNLIGMAGDDTADGGEGNDGLGGSEGTDRLSGGPGDDGMDGGPGDDVLDGGPGLDTMYGDVGADTLDGGQTDASYNYLYGGDGDDHLVSTPGNDVLDGGDGVDWADYTLSAAALRTDLAIGVAEGHGIDLLPKIENILGTPWADDIAGNYRDNELQGLGGDDQIRGGNGVDRIGGGDGADTLSGGAGDDIIRAGKGRDRMFGYTGQDFCDGEAGWDSQFNCESVLSVPRTTVGGVPSVEHGPRAAVIGEVVPGPVHQDLGPVAKAHEVDDVQAEPGHPADEAVESATARELDDGAVATDRGHRALVAVVEGLGRQPVEPPDDLAGHMDTTLDGGLGDLRKHVVGVDGDVADRQDLGVAGHAEIGPDHDPPASAQLHPQEGGDRVRSDSRGPRHGARHQHPTVGEMHCARIHVVHRDAGDDLHATPTERPLRPTP